MANQDRAIWLDMFYEEWFYRPLKIHPNQTSTLEVALSTFIDRNDNVRICLLLPEGRCKSFKETVIIFPRYIMIPDPIFKGKGIWEIQNPICYKGRYQSMDEFIATCPKIDPTPKKPFYAPMLPLSLCLFPARELSEFRKEHMQKVRDIFYEIKVIEHQQGKYDRMTPELKERKKFVIRKYRALGKPNRLPMEEILNDWSDYLEREYPNNNPDDLLLTPRIVREILKPYIKALTE